MKEGDKLKLKEAPEVIGEVALVGLGAVLVRWTRPDGKIVRASYSTTDLSKVAEPLHG